MRQNNHYIDNNNDLVLAKIQEIQEIKAKSL